MHIGWEINTNDDDNSSHVSVKRQHFSFFLIIFRSVSNFPKQSHIKTFHGKGKELMLCGWGQPFAVRGSIGIDFQPLFNQTARTCVDNGKSWF